MTAPPQTETKPATRDIWPGIPPHLIPDYDSIVTEDNTPVGNIFSEKQMRLLTESLYSSWPGPGNERPFLALSNVPLFYMLRQPPLVPDVMLSLNVGAPTIFRPERNLSYFVWDYGKPPEVVIDIISDQESKDIDNKIRDYAQMAVLYYILFDPVGYVQSRPLRAFALRSSGYTEIEPGKLPGVGLGMTLWRGTFEGKEDTWLRWCNAEGKLILTGAERVKQLEEENARLRARLRELGVDLGDTRV
jgi:hypothetical protein